jgi:hypothetical protein
MRYPIAPATLWVVAALAAGCTAGTPAAAPRSAPPPAAPADCADAHRVINQATAAFTADVDRAVAAAGRGDRPAQAAALAEVRAVFTTWSAELESIAGKTSDDRLSVALTEYAGAVRATIARVRTAADLEQLASFDDQELDVAANTFARVCP